jgi:hypothetical protein
MERLGFQMTHKLGTSQKEKEESDLNMSNVRNLKCQYQNDICSMTFSAGFQQQTSSKSMKLFAKCNKQDG